jgi:hypothetical protein
MGEVFKVGESVSYWSYLDGEDHTGNIEYFTEQGLGVVAAIRESGRIVLIRVGEFFKETK